MLMWYVMSRFTTTDSWDNNGLIRRNWILWNELEESEPVSNSGAREKIVKLYKQICYTLIYIYIYIYIYILTKLEIKIKIQIVSINAREI